jgi:hypothetical protein
VPPLFATHDAVLAEDYMGIVKNVCRTLERDATVIQLVDPVSFRCSIQIAPLYKMYNVHHWKSTDASFARKGRLTIGLQVANLPHSKWPKSSGAQARPNGASDTKRQTPLNRAARDA